MSATRYEPGDTWPEHDDKNWKRPLAEARWAGWTLNYINAPHKFGVVTCPAGEHAFDVGKTPRNSETKAKEASKRIRWCGHPPPGQVQDRRDRSQQLLEVAGDLTSEAANGLDRAGAKQVARKELDRLEIQLNTAASNVEEVLQEAALQAAIEVDDAPSLPVLTEQLDKALVALARGMSIAKSVRAEHPGVAKPLLEQAEGLRTRIATLRIRLAVLQERMRPDSR